MDQLELDSKRPSSHQEKLGSVTFSCSYRINDPETQSAKIRQSEEKHGRKTQGNGGLLEGSLG